MDKDFDMPENLYKEGQEESSQGETTGEADVEDTLEKTMDAQEKDGESEDQSENLADQDEELKGSDDWSKEAESHECPLESEADEEGKPLEDEFSHEEVSRMSLKNRVLSYYNSHKRLSIGLILTLCSLVIIYLGFAQFFKTHYFFGTTINDIAVSGKTVEEVEDIMSLELETYNLTLKGRGGRIETLTASEIGLKYNSEEDFQVIKDGQNPFGWVSACFNTEDSKERVGFTYNEHRLKERIGHLTFFDPRYMVEPKNPSFKYTNPSYEIVDEIPGNVVDKELLIAHVTGAILQGECELDLEAAGCYMKPRYTSASRKTLENKDLLNRYVSTRIRYEFGDLKETLEGHRIKDWLYVNDEYQVVFDEDKVMEYVDELAKKFNTRGKTRSFKTSSGKTVKVGGGDYGWAIDRSKEAEYLIAAIKGGKTTSKEPEFSQTAFARGSNDIGNTYVEINLGGQHIWFYKNGKLIVHGDIVTGNVSRNHTTPKGIYRLKYKAKNVVLRGPDYAAPVTFWMPFNGGIGMHDASWRSSFGGNIYKTNGSHGCINCPYNVAKAIYNNIKPNTPVICY